MPSSIEDHIICIMHDLLLNIYNKRPYPSYLVKSTLMLRFPVPLCTDRRSAYFIPSYTPLFGVNSTLRRPVSLR
jgi:hypothetical protein